MSNAEQFRAFARECIASAENANDIDQRVTLLELAMQWAFAAARLDNENRLKGPLCKSVDEAKQRVRGAGGAASASRDRGEGSSDTPAN